MDTLAHAGMLFSALATAALILWLVRDDWK